MTAVVRFFTKLDTWTGRIDYVVKIVIATAMFIMFGLLLLNVLSRYVILQPFFWLAEGAGYMMAMVGLFGSSTCIRHSAHMQVNLIPKKLGGADGQAHRVAVHVMKILALSLVIGYSYVMIRYGYAFAEFGRNEYSPSGFFIVYWPRLALPLGGLLIALQSFNLIGRSVVALIGRVAPPNPQDEED
ncbi:MAG: TRAP transporter small permease subunit [Alkalispirochaeta sp.]